jgi:regulator of protease activity HflC (stomatin/prohibitin superfamily)
MFILKSKKIRSYEKGLLFRDREFVGLLGTGRHWFFDPLGRVRIDVVSQRVPWLTHADLDVIVKAGVLGEEARVIDLKDDERALVWIDGRFAQVLDAGLYAIWTAFRDVRVEIVDARKVLLEHAARDVVLKSPGVDRVLNAFSVEEGHVGVLFKDGEFLRMLEPGRYASWNRVGAVKLRLIDAREKVLEVSGQEIMTADKVSLRVNALTSYRVTDARVSVEQVSDVEKAVYREAQLALRAVIGTRELDALLADKNVVAEELQAALRRRAGEFGVEVIALGIRDLILPGDMKQLLNQVIEARKAAEANAIARREETAAVRSQMNTAKLLEANPALMRLRELEVLEKVAETSKLNVVLGEKGLADRVMNLL